MRLVLASGGEASGGELPARGGRLPGGLPEGGRRPVAAGEPVLLELAAINEGDAAIALDFASGQRYDFEVYAEDGALAWHWAEGIFFTMELGRETLEPGAFLRWSERIAEGLPEPGVYRVRATLASTTPRTVVDTLVVVPAPPSRGGGG